MVVPYRHVGKWQFPTDASGQWQFPTDASGQWYFLTDVSVQPIGPETSVRSYHSTLRDMLEG